MTVIDLISTLFLETWNLINSTQVPGLTFTYGNILSATIIISASLKIMSIFFGVGGKSSTGGNNKNIKVSNDRRSDEK